MAGVAHLVFVHGSYRISKNLVKPYLNFERHKYESHSALKETRILSHVYYLIYISERSYLSVYARHEPRETQTLH